MRQGADRGKLKARKKDLYETAPEATHALIRTGALNQFRVILEPCAGRGAISQILKDGGWRVISRDLIAYPGADKDVLGGVDFFKTTNVQYLQAIVTNPPYNCSDAFIRHALTLGIPVIVLMRLMALEGARRGDILEHLHHVYIGIERLPMMHRDGWKKKRQEKATMPFAWYVFRPEKRLGDTFTCSRISWREEDKNGLDIDDSGVPDASPEAEGRTDAVTIISIPVD